MPLSALAPNNELLHPMEKSSEKRPLTPSATQQSRKRHSIPSSTSIVFSKEGADNCFSNSLNDYESDLHSNKVNNPQPQALKIQNSRDEFARLDSLPQNVRGAIFERGQRNQQYSSEKIAVAVGIVAAISKKVAHKLEKFLTPFTPHHLLSQILIPFNFPQSKIEIPTHKRVPSE
ncbi:predicted protein [Botrytis cinerea T4]|uniref:Uncharacterized protein n=1 Tax=Botryotinia fuckeliana (strain T4) TaxID=999810 RepID=G2XSF3_BOTF4|nr:predicted protein [Botrytis cinerea T4]